MNVIRGEDVIPEDPLSMGDVIINFKQVDSPPPSSHRYILLRTQNSLGEVTLSASSERGCNTRSLLCLRLLDSQSPGADRRGIKLAPIRITALKKFARHVLEYGETGPHIMKDIVLRAAKALCNLKGESVFRSPKQVDNILVHLNTLTAEPLLQRWGRMLAFLELSPIHNCSQMAHIECSRNGRSCTFDENNQRNTLREGYCFIKNRSSQMRWCRRVTHFGFAGGIAACFSTGFYTISHEVGDPDPWVQLLIWAIAICLCVILICLPNIFPKTSRHLPAPRDFSIWLILKPHSLSFFYKHEHVADGLPAEGALLLLPGLRLREPQYGLLDCLSSCAMICKRYELQLISVDGKWVLSFRSAVERDLWRKAIQKAMVAARLKKGSTDERSGKRGQFTEVANRFPELKKGYEEVRSKQEKEARVWYQAAVPDCQSAVSILLSRCCSDCDDIFQDACAMGSFADVQNGCEASWCVLWCV